MDGFFNPTVHGRQNESDGAMRTRIEGLLRRIGDLEGENKTLRAKISGQRAALRKLNQAADAIRVCELKSGADAVLAVARAQRILNGMNE